MLKLTAFILFSLLFSFAARAQHSQVSGKVTDSSEKKDLANSSILLLNKSDSILIRHARSGSAGDFRLTKVPPGHYLVLVTYPTYADYVDTLDIKDSGDIILPPISLVLKSKLLQEVVVRGSKGGMRIKGDTVEFNADSFRTQPNATVEELLKKLPGIEVDRNGKITAQGETVKKVLVDGEEFFGDDPTLVTQNLRADMVDKVQLYDKKSDQATFTGIDDGQRDKTINLKLKDSKKNGYFGRATASAGTDGYYDEELMANYFKKKLKLAGYGFLSNTGKTGLNWQDRDTYGQSFASNLDVDENTGSVSFNAVGGQDDLDNWDGQYSGQGFPTVKTGGLHFNNKWNDDAQSLNGNYKYMDLSVNGNSTTNTETILPDTLFYNNQTQKFNNQIFRNSVNAIYEAKFDTTSSLKLMGNWGIDHKITNELDQSEALASDSSLVNQNTHTLSAVVDNRGYNGNLLWRKKLGKPGRTISLNVRENYSDKVSSGYLYSNTEFYNAGAPIQDSLINQYKKYQTTNTLVEPHLLYTEPVGKGSFLGVGYDFSINNTHSDRNSYNKSTDGKYDALDAIYSNNYQFNVMTQGPGLSYTLIRKKFRFSAGNDVAFASYDQKDLNADTAVKRNFVFWHPVAAVNYNFAAQTRLSLYYNGVTTAPTLQQLQPILSNENPLNVVIGNPGLKPQFANAIGGWFNDYKLLTQRGIFINARYTFTSNAIGNSSTVDSTDKQTTQSTNVNGNYTFSGNFGYNFRWSAPDLHIGFNTGANQSRNVSVVDDLNNVTKSGTYTFRMDFWKSKEKKYEFFLAPSVSYTTSQSSISPGVITHYFTYEIQPNADIFLPLKFQIHGDADINLRQKTAAFTTNNNVYLVNGWVGKKFLKGDALLLKAAVNDLLDQNNGFNRNVNSNFVTQTTYSTIKRYFLFSVVWNFTKPGTPAPPNRN